MKYKIRYTKSYLQRAGKFIKKRPDLESQYEKTLKLLEVNPYHPSIRLHRLKGKMNDLHSVSINIQYQITLYCIFKDNQILPVSVGSHVEVY